MSLNRHILKICWQVPALRIERTPQSCSEMTHSKFTMVINQYSKRKGISHAYFSFSLFLFSSLGIVFNLESKPKSQHCCNVLASHFSEHRRAARIFASSLSCSIDVKQSPWKTGKGEFWRFTPPRRSLPRFAIKFSVIFDLPVTCTLLCYLKPSIIIKLK